MPSGKDIVVEARKLLADPQMEPFLFGVTRDVFRSLADEAERMRLVVNAAVEWRRIGYERKDEFSYRIGPLLDAIDVYDVGQRRPCEEL